VDQFENTILNVFFSGFRLFEAKVPGTVHFPIRCATIDRGKAKQFQKSRYRDFAFKVEKDKTAHLQ